MSQIVLYICIAFYILFIPLNLIEHITLLRGKKVKRADGSVDEIETFPEYYAYALSNIFSVVPAVVSGIILVLLNHRMGFYLMAVVSFWMVFNFFARTATSLKVYKPTITLKWILDSPIFMIVGLTYICWSLVNFSSIYPTYETQELSLISNISLYVIMAIYMVIIVGLFDYQYKVATSKVPTCPGGEPDDWKKYPPLYGGAMADLLINCPLVTTGMILILFNCRVGFYLVAIATSILIWCWSFILFEIKSHKPKVTFMWIVSFIVPPLISLTFLLWTIIHFDAIY